MILLARFVHAACHLHHSASRHSTLHQLIQTVSHGTQGYHGAHHHVGLHADIEVSIGTYHRRTRRGADVLVGSHGVVEGALATATEHNTDRGVKSVTDMINDTRFDCYASDGSRIVVNIRARLDADIHTCCPRHIHLIRHAQRRALCQFG